MMQRHQRADHAVQRGERIADADVHAHRRPVGEARDVAHATHRFADRAEARPVAVRAGLAEAGQTNHDQSRVDGRERVVAEAPFLERAGPEILDDDVGLPGKPARDLLAVRRTQIHGHRLLVARLDVPPQRRAVVQQAPLPQGIAHARRLDLDHLGAEFGKDFPRERPCNELAELQHLDSVQHAHGDLRFPSPLRGEGRVRGG